MDAAGVRRLGRGDRAQHDLGASAALVARARHRGTRSARLPRLAAGPPPAGRRVSGFKFPHPLVLLVAGTALAAAASWVLPAGHYERRDDPVTGRRVVVAGTYHAVPPRPVGPWRALVAIPKGMADAASVIFFVFLIGGAFTVVDRTGALRGAVDWLVRRLARRDALVIPAACLTFALGGVLDNMKEEIIALVPVMLLLVRRLGFDSVTAVAASLGAAAVGAAFSPINPFQVGIAQQLAQLPLLSGSLFRSARPGAHRRHDRARAVHACRGPAPRALRPGHVAAARRRPRRRAQRQRPRRADAAHPRPPVRPAGPVASGDGARLPVRRWAVRAADADQRRAHGDPGRGGRALRALAQIRVAAVRPAPRAGRRRDRPWHRGGPALASGRVSCARESWSWHVSPARRRAYRGNPRPGAAADRGAVSGLGAESGQRGAARRRPRRDWSRRRTEPAQSPAAHRIGSGDRADGGARCRSAPQPQAVGRPADPHGPDAVTSHPELCFSRRCRGVSRLGRHTPETRPGAQGAARAAQHRPRGGYAPAGEGPERVSPRKGGTSGDAGPPHVPRRLGPLSGLLHRPAVVDEQSSGAVRRALAGSSRAGGRERRGEPHRRIVAQDLAEDRDPRHGDPMTGQIALLLDVYDQAFDHRARHGTPLAGAIRGLSHGDALWRPRRGRHNIWEIVLHTAYWKYIVRRRLMRDGELKFPRRGSNWPRPPVPADAAAWKRDVAPVRGA